mmetsp:Transcript_68762/g.121491  ORF Transcript_68762/g.121491 Transcript_68762/m.121491 type:complete len:179 (-) Transcript_68762:40-576(-)
MQELMSDPGTVRVLQSLGVDVPFLQDLQVMTYSIPGTTFPIEMLIEQMLICRSGLSSTVKHVVIQTKLINWTLGNNITSLENRLDGLQNDMLRMLDTRNTKLLRAMWTSQQRRPESRPVTPAATEISRPSSPDNATPTLWKTAFYRKIAHTRARSPNAIRGQVIRPVSAGYELGGELL